MKQFAKVIDVQGVRTTNSGNVVRRVVLLHADGYTTEALTKPDCSLGYTVRNFLGKCVSYTTKQHRGNLCLETCELADVSGKTARYLGDQFAALLAETQEYKLQINSTASGKTKWLNIDRDTVAQLRDILILKALREDFDND